MKPDGEAYTIQILRRLADQLEKGTAKALEMSFDKEIEETDDFPFHMLRWTGVSTVSVKYRQCRRLEVNK